MSDPRLTKDALRELFALAGVDIGDVSALPDGYGQPGQDWWRVQTAHGQLDVGWRAPTIWIDWYETPARLDASTNDAQKLRDWLTSSETFARMLLGERPPAD